MHFLIDGYNLIFSLMDSEKSLEALRKETIAYFQKAFSQKKIKGTLVFDGAHFEEEESGLSYQNALTIAFTPKGQSADEYIIERVERAKNRKNFTVVSNDRGLHRHIQALGGNLEKNQAFISWLEKKKIAKESDEMKDSPQNIERLQKIFEEKLENPFPPENDSEL